MQVTQLLSLQFIKPTDMQKAIFVKKREKIYLKSWIPNPLLHKLKDVK